MKIKKGGCCVITTETKYNKHYKRLGYKIVKEAKVEEAKEDDEINLSELTVRELREIASENNIKEYTKLKKEELIKAVNEVI